MRESVIYQDILQQGRQKEALLLVMRLLTRRLGEVEPTLQEQIRGLSLAQLETLGEDLLDFGQPLDLVAWLNEQRQ